MWYIKPHKMKRLFLFLTILSSFSSFSQNFVQDHKQWNVIIEAFGIGGISKATEIYSISGDTLIYDHTYYKIYVSFDSLINSIYKGAIREENNQVFYVNNFGEEGVLYDFNLEVGDTTYLITDYTYNDERVMAIVDSIELVEIGGVFRNKFWIHNDLSWDAHDYWLDGIGSNNGLLNTFIHYYWICPYWQLSCCFENGVQIFQHESLDCYSNTVGIEEIYQNQVLISPNPIGSGNSLLIQMPEKTKISFIECFDLSGNLIFKHTLDLRSEIAIQLPDLKSGIYLLKIHPENGSIISKKIVVE